MSDNASPGSKAFIEFKCPSGDCDGVFRLTLENMSQPGYQAVCPVCHTPFEFDEVLRSKLARMLNLIVVIRDSEDLLGDAMISVNVAGGSVKIPYAMMLTRLNTVITLDLGGTKTDFHLRVEPSGAEMFR
ncbi:MAG: hypothetical protein IKD29_01090 [Lentisphaeria bacterium]|nr:hypothetical protein [Lentisphaerota bacterium]MBR2632012.1 hypothetical protein [Lentisphaeria bacterium]